MSNVVIGIDPSSRAMHAVVTYVDDIPSLLVQQLHKTDKPLANAQAFQWAYDMVKFYKMEDVYVFVEIPVMGRAGAHTMLTIAKAVGAVSAGATIAGAKVVEVNNQTWKKQVVGKGNCGKPEIRAWCKDSWPKVYDMADGNQDLMDAAAINVYGRMVVDRIKPAKKTGKRPGLSAKSKKVIVKKKRSV